MIALYDLKGTHFWFVLVKQKMKRTYQNKMIPHIHLVDERDFKLFLLCYSSLRSSAVFIIWLNVKLIGFIHDCEGSCESLALVLCTCFMKKQENQTLNVINLIEFNTARKPREILCI